MGAVPGLIAHGGTAGAVVEALLGIAVVGLFVAVWLRERRSGDDAATRSSGPAELRDDDGPAS